MASVHCNKAVKYSTCGLFLKEVVVLQSMKKQNNKMIIICVSGVSMTIGSVLH